MSAVSVQIGNPESHTVGVGIGIIIIGPLEAARL